MCWYSLRSFTSMGSLTNSSMIIALIPKKNNASHIRYFRPISSKWLSQFCKRTPTIRRIQWSLYWWGRLRGRRSWDVMFHWDFNDWELDLLAAFLHLLESHIPFIESGDWVRWRLRKNGKFDIRSYYNLLWGLLPSLSLEKVFGVVKVHRQVSFFVWTAMWGFTGDNLRRRGCTIVDWCYMC